MLRALVAVLLASLIPPLSHALAQGTESLPAGWRRVGPPEGVRLYEIQLDTVMKHSGVSSLRLSYTGANPTDIGTVVSQSFLADTFRAKRVRLSGWVRTDAVNGSGQLWMRIDGSPEGTPFDNMSDRRISGTTDWRSYALVLDVPSHATVIHIGAIFTGQGTMWLDEFAFAVADSTAALTGRMRESADRPPVRNLPSRPINLGFEPL